MLIIAAHVIASCSFWAAELGAGQPVVREKEAAAGQAFIRKKKMEKENLF